MGKAVDKMRLFKEASSYNTQRPWMDKGVFKENIKPGGFGEFFDMKENPNILNTSEEREKALRLRERSIDDKIDEMYLEHIQAMRDLEDETKNLAADQAEAQKGWAQQEEVLKRVSGPLAQYRLHLAVINGLHEEGKLTWEETNRLSWEEYQTYIQSSEALQKLNGDMTAHMIAVTKIEEAKKKGLITQAEAIRLLKEENAEYVKQNEEKYKQWEKKNTKSFDGTSGDTILKMRDGFKELGADILDISDDVVAGVQKMNNAVDELIINAVEKGDFEWKKFGETMLHILNEVMIAMLKAALLRAIVGAAGGGLDPSYFTGANKILYGGKHATGGSYTVPGSGAPDSVRTFFDLTPGEKVHFQPPGQGMPSMLGYRADRSAPMDYNAMGRAVAQATSSRDDQPRRREKQVIAVQQTTNPRALLAVLKSSEGRAVILDTARQNPDVFASILKK
jgi:hypothetical protein